MPKLRGLITKIAVSALFASLYFLALAHPALAGNAGRAAASSSDDKANTATPAHAIDSTKDGSKTAVTDPGSTPTSNAALVDQLQQLKETVQAQAQRLVEHTQELESERSALRDELDRIAKLETALNVTPGTAKGNSRGEFCSGGDHCGCARRSHDPRTRSR